MSSRLSSSKGCRCSTSRLNVSKTTVPNLKVSPVSTPKKSPMKTTGTTSSMARAGSPMRTSGSPLNIARSMSPMKTTGTSFNLARSVSPMKSPLLSPIIRSPSSDDEMDAIGVSSNSLCLPNANQQFFFGQNFECSGGMQEYTITTTKRVKQANGEFIEHTESVTATLKQGSMGNYKSSAFKALK